MTVDTWLVSDEVSVPVKTYSICWICSWFPDAQDVESSLWLYVWSCQQVVTNKYFTVMWAKALDHSSNTLSSLISQYKNCRAQNNRIYTALILDPTIQQLFDWTIIYVCVYSIYTYSHKTYIYMWHTENVKIHIHSFLDRFIYTVNRNAQNN